MTPGVDDFAKLKFSRITLPDRRGYVGEAPDWHIAGRSDGADYFGFWSWSPGSVFRHGKRMNIWFLDGHASSVSYQEAYKPFGDPRKFTP
jgi:prepilin-type processing-associated H-X9-DG protein